MSLPHCDVCGVRIMQHHLATKRDGAWFSLRLCYTCFDTMRDIMAMYFLQHGWHDADGNDYRHALETSNYCPMGEPPAMS